MHNNLLAQKTQENIRLILKVNVIEQKMQTLTQIDWDNYRLQGDKIADEIVAKTQELNQWEHLRKVITIQWGDNQSLPTDLPDFIRNYFTENAVLPPNSDSKKIAKGQEFFQKNAEDCLSLLGTMSLPYCYAAADGAQVLYFSERMRNDAQKRLLETARFVFEVNQKDSLKEEGLAFITILKVRLLHATIRFHVKNHKDWNMKWGLPINQEDLMGTNIAFSSIILRGLRKLGKKYTNQDAENYLHLCYVVGQLLGIDKKILPQTMKEAVFLSQNTEMRHFKSSHEGNVLMQTLLSHFEEILPPVVPDGYIHSYMRFLLGDRVCDLLGIPAANWTKHIVNTLPIITTMKASFGKSPHAVRSYWEARNLIAQQK